MTTLRQLSVARGLDIENPIDRLAHLCSQVVLDAESRRQSAASRLVVTRLWAELLHLLVQGKFNSVGGCDEPPKYEEHQGRRQLMAKLATITKEAEKPEPLQAPSPEDIRMIME